MLPVTGNGNMINRGKMRKATFRFNCALALILILAALFQCSTRKVSHILKLDAGWLVQSAEKTVYDGKKISDPENFGDPNLYDLHLECIVGGQLSDRADFKSSGSSQSMKAGVRAKFCVFLAVTVGINEELIRKYVEMQGKEGTGQAKLEL